MATVSLLAHELGCYKMTLECKDKLIPFYNSLGYVLEPGNGNSMQIRFEAAAAAAATSAASAPAAAAPS